MTTKPNDTKWPRGGHGRQRAIEDPEGERETRPVARPDQVWDSKEARERLEETPEDEEPTRAQAVMMDADAAEEGVRE